MARKRIKGCKPRALAMVICEMVTRDEATKNVCLLGLFNRLTAPGLPMVHSRLHVFVSLAVFEAKGEMAFEDPLSVADLNIEIRGLMFEVPGNYVFEFHCGGELLTMRRFSVVVEKQP
jgi:hypothetical protein